MRIAHLAFTASLTIAAPALSQPIEMPRGVIAFAEAATRIVLQTAMSAARSQVELTYDDIVLDLAAGRIALNGVTIRPDLPWDVTKDCVAQADAFEFFSPAQFDASTGRIEIVGLDLPLACLPPDPQGAIAAAGYEAVRAPSLSIDFDYQASSSALDLTIAGALEDAIAFEAAVEFAYFWVQTPGVFQDEGALPAAGGQPQQGKPIADLTFAEIALTDDGILDRAGPMLAEMIGGFEAAPPMVEGIILQELGADGQPFATEMRSAVQNFLSGDGKLVLTVAPDQPVRLAPELFDDPIALYAALDPRASGRPVATTALVDRDLLESARAGNALSDDGRLAVGTALAAGVGAPRSPELARDVLAPLVASWNPDAALIASESYGLAAPEMAYGFALIAATGGADGGLARLDRVEAQLDFAAISDAQEAAFNDWPEGAEATLRDVIATGDLAETRDLASDFEKGVGVPRNYKAAYLLATLAAAGGDRSSAALRDRIDARLSRRGAGSTGWAETRADASSSALGVWLDGGLLDWLAE
ncbi:MAG: hypothetical protein P8Q48_03750 [Paracoccaceae bacterium]|nr:hypothetical protein [Paracoccaceae bacterium]MDG1369349.1 hypothetical protein [Paracoccaceae bacterium]